MSVPGAVAGYFDLDHYRAMQAVVRGWLELVRIEPSRTPSAEDHEAVCRLLFVEARLLDQRRLDEWLGLFTADAAYWLPSDVSGADPTVTVSWEFNDRRRMEERVDRLRTGMAHSQIPPTRTVHTYSNIESIQVAPDVIHVLCNFQIQTASNAGVSVRAGWNGFILRRENGRWMIVLKRINLFDADRPQGNNSFTL